MPRMSVEVVRVDVDVPEGESSHPRGRVVGYADVEVDGVPARGLEIVYTSSCRTVVELPSRLALTPAAERHLRKSVGRAWMAKVVEEMRERIVNYRYTEELLDSPEKYREEHLLYRSVTGAPEYGIYGRLTG